VRALTIDAHGGLEQITYREDVPVPGLRAPTDVRVRLRSVALNHLDLWTVGGLPGIRITPPWVLGADGCGDVEQVGSAVADVAVGDRVVINPANHLRIQQQTH
jgi:NADPH:quinone reductase-like Zn-dependent oxidoreductase